MKVSNETDNTFQIEICFDDDYMYGRILSRSPVNMEYSIYNAAVSYIQRNKRFYQTASVWRSERDKRTGSQTKKELYVNECEITYELPDEIKIEERGV